MLFEKIKNRESGIVLYGIVPPKKATEPDKLEEIARKIMDRLPLDILDGLVIYDIQDEVSRTTENRPFPFIESMDGFLFCNNQLRKLSLPKIIYRAIGKYSQEELSHFLSDYHYYGREQGFPLVPIIFTLTPCGSTKTLQFMQWLGISIPRWLENELVHSQDILERSLQVCADNWAELSDFAGSKKIPIGCNIESVAIRKVEVEASFELLRKVTHP